MNTISLSVYCITLYKRFKNKDLENLSSFDHGKDFLSLVDQLFCLGSKMLSYPFTMMSKLRK